jgi:hypothetical protein
VYLSGSQGLAAKIKGSKKKTQTGAKKGNGRQTTLEKANPTAATIKKIKKEIAKYKKSKAFGLRSLAATVSKILRLELIGQETMRRMMSEISLRPL